MGVYFETGKTRPYLCRTFRLLGLSHPAEFIHSLVVDSLQVDRLAGSLEFFDYFPDFQPPDFFPLGYRCPRFPLMESHNNVILPTS